MNGSNLSSNDISLPNRRGLCGHDSPGCYQELSPREFNIRKDMAVVILKDADAAREFRGYLGVSTLPSSNGMEEFLAGFPPERAMGLVCPDGECSGRLAIRLSRQGYQIFHLAGGLHEWRKCEFC